MSYLVPHMENWSQWLQEKNLPPVVDAEGDNPMVQTLKRFRGLCDDARTMLKAKVPNYMVPSVFIPLEKMPLNPNGKIDRKVLPYPDAAELTAAYTSGATARSQFSENERFVGEIWGNRIPGQSSNTIDLEDRFFDIGGRSMVGQAILFDVRKRKNISLSMNTLFQNPTVREFASVLDASPDPSKGEKQDSTPPEMDYHLDGEILQVKEISPLTFPASGDDSRETFFVTGGTYLDSCFPILEQSRAAREPGVNLWV